MDRVGIPRSNYSLLSEKKAKGEDINISDNKDILQASTPRSEASSPHFEGGSQDCEVGEVETPLAAFLINETNSLVDQEDSVADCSPSKEPEDHLKVIENESSLKRRSEGAINIQSEDVSEQSD